MNFEASPSNSRVIKYKNVSGKNITELLVPKGYEHTVNNKKWKNTGAYWKDGSNTKLRTTKGRGTHKVYKNIAPEIKQQLSRASAAATRNVTRHLKNVGVNNGSASNRSKNTTINANFLTKLVRNPENVPYGAKFSRGILNMNVEKIRKYAMRRYEEGIPVNKIASEIQSELNTADKAAKEFAASRPKLSLGGKRKFYRRTHRK